MSAPMYVPVFVLRQRFAMTTNRYELQGLTPDGQPGRCSGWPSRSAWRFKEEVTFYADDTKARKVFSFKAREVMDLNAGYDVFDEAHQQIGFFRKDFGASLLRSTFQIEGPGYAGTGQERSQGVALLRRFADIPFLPIHFDYATAEGQPLLSIERQGSVRDRYTVRVPDPRVDFRVAAAVAVAMDALMAR